MMAIINWFIAPYKTVRSELQLLTLLKKQDTTSKDEKMRIYQLQSFNILLLLVYSLSFVAFFVYIGLLFVAGWYALSGIIVGLIMMSLIKVMQEKRYLKRRDAFIKNDPTLIKS
jgi:membrane associated rhomboid family serine protease